jgi:serine/threonine protein phosphatase PrpC
MAHDGMNGKVSKPRSGLFAVFDGHGGRDAVNFLEKNFHKELEKQLKLNADPQKAIEECFLNIDQQMARNPKFQECGSTACIAYVRTNPLGKNSTLLSRPKKHR